MKNVMQIFIYMNYVLFCLVLKKLFIHSCVLTNGQSLIDQSVTCMFVQNLCKVPLSWTILIYKQVSFCTQFYVHMALSFSNWPIIRYHS